MKLINIASRLLNIRLRADTERTPGYLGELTVGDMPFGGVGWEAQFSIGDITPKPVTVGDAVVIRIEWFQKTLTVESDDPTALKFIYIGSERYDLINGSAFINNNPFPAEGETIKIGINRRPVLFPVIFDQTFSEAFA
jgi:hypothetical protein